MIRQQTPRRCASVLGVLATLGPAMMTNAQLTPSRLYFGVNRPIPMTVAVPADAGDDAAVAIDLLAPGPAGSSDATSVAQVEVESGGVDLAGLFPILWTAEHPRLLYAQLVVAGDPVGPAVVLQPLLTPARAQAAGRSIQFAPSQGVYSGLRAYVDQHVVFDTSEGQIEIALRPDQAPNTAYNLLSLVQGGFYTDIIVHRVVPTNPQGNPFVIQFGDPTGTGEGGPGYFSDLEPSNLPHDFGVVSMARTNNPDTNGSQVFICLSRAGTSFLDHNYVSFAQTVKGADTIIRIERTPLESPQSGRPTNPPVIKKAWTVDAPPYGAGPAPVKRPPASDGSR